LSNDFLDFGFLVKGWEEEQVPWNEELIGG